MDYDEDVPTKELLKLTNFVRESEGTISNALHRHAERMDDAAKQARAAFEAGHSDELMTNQGYRMSAQLFEESAKEARDVAATLVEMLDAIHEAS